MKLAKPIIVLFFSFFVVFNTQAQGEVAPTPTLESPYNTMYVHLYYLQPDSYQPAVAALTVSPSVTDSIKRVQHAIKLKQILDGRGLYVRLNLIPQDLNYTDSTTQKHFYTPFPVKLPEIYLEKVDDKWYYSFSSIKSISALHKATYPFGTDKLLNLFPIKNNNRFLGLALWQYAAIAILIFLIWLGRIILSRLLLPVLNSILKSRLKSYIADPEVVLKIAHSISLIFFVWLARILVPVLQLPIGAAEWAILALNITLTVVIIILLLRILNLVVNYLGKFTEATESKMDEQLMPILHRIFQILIVLGGIIQIMSLLEVNVTALIAGVSIGGLALALAAQDTVKNLIGSAMIFFDRPFQIGDYVVGAGIEGTIVEVGFRTTRIKSIDTSIVSVPNGSIANMVVDNKGMREFRLFHTNIGLTYDTPSVLIEKYIEGLKLIIQNHPSTVKEGYYVNFSKLDASALNLFVRTHLDVPDYATELKVKEELLFGIIRLAETLGVRFAFPSSTLYVEEFPGTLSGVPSYRVDQNEMSSKLDEFIKDFKGRNSKQSPDS